MENEEEYLYPWERVSQKMSQRERDANVTNLMRLGLLPIYRIQMKIGRQAIASGWPCTYE
jgi:hypothetical protein